MSNDGNSSLGFWGAPTSTIDWCEANYLVTFYIAEFFNSTTSFFLVFAGLLPLLLHTHLWHVLERRFAIAFVSVAIVGLGSVAFHGTLLFHHQLYSLLEHYQEKPVYGPILPIGLACYASVATWATSQHGGNTQWFSFHTMFAACEFSALFLIVKFFRGLDDSESTLKQLMRRGFMSYVVAIIVWLSDLNFCGWLQQLPGYNYWNLHAFGWHLFTSCGLYAMMLGLWYHRLRCVLGVKVKLSCTSAGIPVMLSEEKSS
eukprot:TRINITY_DN34540_c0_g1_i2.p1 TRINITY_DN34540_c0_g1~~TRINITY_DN34540_c0_g1_i2.p1  ORF type:complete len:270 (+),score=37.80 TRINITY_DN34540_c0_g1_i2:39-812(+)